VCASIILDEEGKLKEPQAPNGTKIMGGECISDVSSGCEKSTKSTPPLQQL
jgi:hypothetical protein